MSLTCSLVYTAKRDKYRSAIERENVNYICADNKIHIRFRDYNSYKRIYGFEAKLTYLLTYLMNYSYLPTVIRRYDDNVLISDFLKTSDLRQVYLAIKNFTNHSNFRGFKAAKNYRKNNCISFGNVDINCFPSDIGNDGVERLGSLTIFLHYFHDIDLTEYLFNDAYSIILHEDKEIPLSKFQKKQMKKDIKEVELNSEYEEDLY